MKLHRMLESIFRAFENVEVQWCLLRGEGDLAAPKGDIDLLVAPADIGRMRTVLRAHSFVPLSSSARCSRFSFIGYHPPTQTWIVLDIATDLAYGPAADFQTHAAAGCLARRLRTGKLYVLAPDDAFWALLMHCMLDKGNFADRHVRRLQELVDGARTDSPLARRVALACPQGWDAAQILERVRRGEWSKLVCLASALAVGWRRSDSLCARWRALARHVWQLPEKALHVLRHRGMSVALLGPDGAGKSTLAANIQQSLRFPVYVVYMGVWPRLPAHSMPTRHRSLHCMHGLAVLWRTAAHLTRIWWRYLAAQYHQTLGRVVIFDRFVYDGLLFTRQSVGWPVWLYLLCASHACPAPDLVVVLDAPGKLLYARKGEETPEFLEAQRQKLLALRCRIPQLQVVDATRAEAAVRADVVSRIWREHLVRWGKHDAQAGTPVRLSN
jgi:thymidylate kinase